MAFFNVFFKTLGFLVAIASFIIILNILLFFLPADKQGFKFIEGSKESSNIIATLNLNGPIVNNLNRTFIGNIIDYIDPSIVKDDLDKLEKINPRILVIRINSPGGTVVATSMLEKIINNFKEKNNIEIYFYTDEILTSGGYWLATTGNRIYAQYGSIIGSIGVTGPSWYYYDNPISISSGIFGQNIETKNGIKIFDQNAGNSKDLYNPFRKPTKKELEHLQDLVSGIYEDFIIKVSSNRKIETDVLKNEIGALIFSSNKAKNFFLIDDVMSYDQLVQKIINENNFENYKVIEMYYKENVISRYLENFFLKDNKLVCDKLDTNLVSILPTYLSSC